MAVLLVCRGSASPAPAKAQGHSGHTAPPRSGRRHAPSPRSVSTVLRVTKRRFAVIPSVGPGGGVGSSQPEGWFQRLGNMLSEDDVHRVDHAVIVTRADWTLASTSPWRHRCSAASFVAVDPLPLSHTALKCRSKQVFMLSLYCMSPLCCTFTLLASIVLLQTPTMSFACVCQSHGHTVLIGRTSVVS